jgi:hypothetical protein
MAPTTNYEVLFLFLFQVQNTRLVSKSAKTKATIKTEKRAKRNFQTKTIKKSQQRCGAPQQQQKKEG